MTDDRCNLGCRSMSGVDDHPTAMKQADADTRSARRGQAGRRRSRRRGEGRAAGAGPPRPRGRFGCRNQARHGPGWLPRPADDSCRANRADAASSRHNVQRARGQVLRVRGCDAFVIVIFVRNPSMARPMPPKRRPRPPLRSRKPRCSRAGTATVTLSAIGGETAFKCWLRSSSEWAFRIGRQV